MYQHVLSKCSSWVDQIHRSNPTSKAEPPASLLNPRTHGSLRKTTKLVGSNEIITRSNNKPVTSSCNVLPTKDEIVSDSSALKCGSRGIGPQKNASQNGTAWKYSFKVDGRSPPRMNASLTKMTEVITSQKNVLQKNVSSKNASDPKVCPRHLLPIKSRPVVEGGESRSQKNAARGNVLTENALLKTSTCKNGSQETASQINASQIHAPASQKNTSQNHASASQKNMSQNHASQKNASQNHAPASRRNASQNHASASRRNASGGFESRNEAPDIIVPIRKLSKTNAFVNSQKSVLTKVSQAKVSLKNSTQERIPQKNSPRDNAHIFERKSNSNADNHEIHDKKFISSSKIAKTIQPLNKKPELNSYSKESKNLSKTKFSLGVCDNDTASSCRIPIVDISTRCEASVSNSQINKISLATSYVTDKDIFNKERIHLSVQNNCKDLIQISQDTGFLCKDLKVVCSSLKKLCEGVKQILKYLENSEKPENICIRRMSKAKKCKINAAVQENRQMTNTVRSTSREDGKIMQRCEPDVEGATTLHLSSRDDLTNTGGVRWLYEAWLVGWNA